MGKIGVVLGTLALVLGVSAAGWVSVASQGATPVAAPTGVAGPPLPRSAAIRAGTCRALEADPRYPLAEPTPVRADPATPVAGETAASPVAGASPSRVSISSTTLSVALADLLARPHAIVVPAAADGAPPVLCGDIVAAPAGGDPVVLLSPADGGTNVGLAWLHPNPDGTTTVDLALVAIQDLCRPGHDGTPSPAASPTLSLDLFLAADQLDVEVNLEVDQIELRLGLTSPLFDLDADLVGEDIDLAVDANVGRLCLDLDLVVPGTPASGTPRASG